MRIKYGSGVGTRLADGVFAERLTIISSGFQGLQMTCLLIAPGVLALPYEAEEMLFGNITQNAVVLTWTGVFWRPLTSLAVPFSDGRLHQRGI